MIRSYDKTVPTLTEVLEEPRWASDPDAARDSEIEESQTAPAVPEALPCAAHADPLDELDATPPAWDDAAQEDFQLILDEPVSTSALPPVPALPNVDEAQGTAELDEPAQALPETMLESVPVPAPAPEGACESELGAEDAAAPVELHAMSAAMAARLEAQLELSLDQFLREQLPMALDEVLARMMPAIAQSMSDVLRPRLQAHVRTALLDFDQAK